ncbi:hypothetical protein [Oscillibacter sp.]|uniref:hypothetical protein n=1 Tax=Oscillibacter sp. TaxID=1945593 RepID=UPI00289F36AF|nr:hypothetical protein [Oscillibacter sp.]
MQCFYSVSDMLRQYEAYGWKRTGIRYGSCFEPPVEVVSGHIQAWGNPEACCFIDTDIVFHANLMERYYYQAKSIQITFVEDMALSYYQKKTERNEARFGVFCYVNNLPRPWYKRFSSGEVQKASTIYITDQFLEGTGAVFSDNFWNRTAHAVNNRDVSLPLLADICREIKSAEMSGEAFSLFLQGKALEAAGLLVDYTLSFGLKRTPSLTTKARDAAKSALQILNQSFVQPPVIEDLAKPIEINKQTLQRAFQQLTGQSIHEYIKSI